MEGHKFEINGYWLMLDPNADEPTVEQLQDFLYQAEKTCFNCKFRFLKSTELNCFDCSLLPINKDVADLKCNWEAKQ